MAFRRIVHKLLIELHGFFIKGWGYCYCCFFCGMKRTKKSCGGDVRAAPRRVSAEKTDGKQAPPSDFFITPTVLSWRSPLTSPPPEEKVASRRKKSASPKKNTAVDFWGQQVNEWIPSHRFFKSTNYSNPHELKIFA